MSKIRNKEEIRLFNKAGLIKLRDFYNINHTKRKNEFNIPFHMLRDDNLTESLTTKKFMDLDEVSTFSSRYELGKYFYNKLNNDIEDHEKNGQGLWEWIALYFLDSLFSSDKGWRLARMDNYIYIPHKKLRDHYDMPVSPNWVENIPTPHRHCTRGPYLAYESFKSDSKLLVNHPKGPHVFGDIAEQNLSRRWTKDFKIIWKVASSIFILPDGTRKAGWSSTSKTKGSLRRFMDVIDSIMYSHNINKMSPSDLKKELGKEFA